MDPAMENRLITAIFELQRVKQTLPPGEARSHLNIAIVAACNAIEALPRPQSEEPFFL